MTSYLVRYVGRQRRKQESCTGTPENKALAGIFPSVRNPSWSFWERWWGEKWNEHGPLDGIPASLSSFRLQSTHHDVSLLYTLCLQAHKYLHSSLRRIQIAIFGVMHQCLDQFPVVYQGQSLLPAFSVWAVVPWRTRNMLHSPSCLEQYLNTPLAFSLARTRAFC